MCGLYLNTYEIVVECFALCTPTFSFVYNSLKQHYVLLKLDPRKQAETK